MLNRTPYPSRLTYWLFLCFILGGLCAHAQSNFASADSRAIPTAANRFHGRYNPGSSINTRFDETKPVISGDGRKLFFARKNFPGNTGGTPDPQDIYYSETQDGVHWTPSKNLGQDLNTPVADNLCAVRDDHTFIFFVNAGKHRGRFVIRAQKNGEQVISGRTGPLVINESRYLEASFSTDGNVVFYTAKTPDNLHYRKDLEERDIYISWRNENGWTNPINAGNSINSPGDEYSPFLAADGKTLYFATNGRGGSGGVDIFMSTKIGSGWTSWSDPVNLGEQINTPGFDAYFTVSHTAEKAYLVSSNRTFARGDIISVLLPEKLRPEPVDRIELLILNALTGEPVEANVTIKNQLNETVRTIVADATGKISTIIPAASIPLEVQHDGFLTKKHVTRSRTQRDTILLTPRPNEVGRSVNILFERGTDQLVRSDGPLLDSLVRLMQTDLSTRIEIHGHTDNMGSMNALRRLSERRVAAIKAHLVQNGVSAVRISGQAFGGTMPATKNDREENRMKNRRAELLIKRL
jgi:outer membrane protein OmpA-like peptidoglycan-associated protein